MPAVITTTAKRYAKDIGTVRKTARYTLHHLKKAHFFVSLYLVTDVQMKELNRKYRKKNKATNVLSFEVPRGFVEYKARGKSVGEVYLAPDYIRKHGENLSYMAVHGILHLFGFDHKKKGDRIRMERTEKFLIKKLKI